MHRLSSTEDFGVLSASKFKRIIHSTCILCSCFIILGYTYDGRKLEKGGHNT